MQCGSCDIIPFWRWLKETQKYPPYITSHDFDGKYLTKINVDVKSIPTRHIYMTAQYPGSVHELQ
jgi:hypothetical protein